MNRKKIMLLHFHACFHNEYTISAVAEQLAAVEKGIHQHPQFVIPSLESRCNVYINLFSHTQKTRLQPPIKKQK